jgi:hypothetical protein
MVKCPNCGDKLLSEGRYYCDICKKDYCRYCQQNHVHNTPEIDGYNLIWRTPSRSIYQRHFYNSDRTILENRKNAIKKVFETLIKFISRKVEKCPTCGYNVTRTKRESKDDNGRYYSVDIECTNCDYSNSTKYYLTWGSENVKQE